MIRIRVNITTGPSHPGSGNVVDKLVQRARDIAAAGIPASWIPQGYDQESRTLHLLGTLA